MEDEFKIFARLFGGRKGVYTLHYKTPSGEERYHKSCSRCARMFPDCENCRGGGFEPLSAKAVAAHMEGRAAVGIYPADENGLCRFSLIELSGEDFRLKLKILASLCTYFGISHLCEITDKGRLWLLFSEAAAPLSAAEPAFDLLREAAASVGGLTIEPWGEVFPKGEEPVMLPLFNLDTGFSILADDDLVPIPDPVEYMDSLVPTPLRTIEPTADFPSKVRVELCNKIYLDTDGISSTGLGAICDLARIPLQDTFKYYVGQSGGKLHLPRGVMDELQRLIPSIEIIDNRCKGRVPQPQNGGVGRIIARDCGTLSAPVGRGKTRLMAGVISALHRPTLILATETVAIKGWRSRLSQILGIDESRISCVTDDASYPNGYLDAALLGPRTELWLAENLSSYGLVIAADVDRLHCGPEVFASVMDSVCAEKVYAITSRPLSEIRYGALIGLYCGGQIDGIF